MGERIKRVIVTGLGTGYLPGAPGTWGSVAVCLVCLATIWGSAGRAVCVTGTMIALAALCTAACVALGRFTEQAFGRKDPSQCTIDEWAGQAVALIALPLGAATGERLLAVGAGLAAFRFFDILKPPPVRQLERLPRGWGVAADDLMAGLLANVVVQVAMRVVWPIGG